MVSTLLYRLKKGYPPFELVVRAGQGARLESWLESDEVYLALLCRHDPVPNRGDVYLTQLRPSWLVRPAMR